MTMIAAHGLIKWRPLCLVNRRRGILGFEFRHQSSHPVDRLDGRGLATQYFANLEKGCRQVRSRPSIAHQRPTGMRLSIELLRGLFGSLSGHLFGFGGCPLHVLQEQWLTIHGVDVTTVGPQVETDVGLL